MSVMIEVELNWTVSHHIALDAYCYHAMPCGELKNASSSCKGFHFYYHFSLNKIPPSVFGYQ